MGEVTRGVPLPVEGEDAVAPRVSTSSPCSSSLSEITIQPAVSIILLRYWMVKSGSGLMSSCLMRGSMIGAGGTGGLIITLKGRVVLRGFLRGLSSGVADAPGRGVLVTATLVGVGLLRGALLTLQEWVVSVGPVLLESIPA